MYLTKEINSEYFSFASDISFRAFSELLGFIFSVTTFTLIARNLNKIDYAIINQATSIVVFVIPILLIRLNSSLCVFLSHVNDLCIHKSRFFTIYILLLPIDIALLAIIIYFKQEISSLFFATDKYTTELIVIFTYFIVMSWSTFATEFFRSISRVKLSTMFTLFRSFSLSILILGSIYIIKKITLQYILFLYLYTEILIFIVSFITILYIYKNSRISLDFIRLREHFAFSLPLIPYTVLTWVNVGFCRIMMNHMMSLTESGIYGFYFAMTTRIYFLNVVVGYTIYPYIAKFWGENNKEKVNEFLKNGFNIGFTFSIPLAIGTVVTAPSLVFLLSGGNFEVDRTIIALFSSAMFFQMFSNIYSYLIDLSRKTSWYNVILFISAFANVVLNYIFIKIYGIHGAVLAFSITSFLQTFLTIKIAVSVSQIKLELDYMCFIRTIVSSIIMTIILLLVYKNTGFFNFIISTLISVFTYFIIYYLIYYKFRNDYI